MKKSKVLKNAVSPTFYTLMVLTMNMNQFINIALIIQLNHIALIS